MRSVIWVLVSTVNYKQADKIGRAVLKQKLCACYGIYPKLKSVYFWPPKSGRTEKSTGPLLVLETLPEKYGEISKTVKTLHSDTLPFIGKLKLDGIETEFYNWMRKEIK